MLSKIILRNASMRNNRNRGQSPKDRHPASDSSQEIVLLFNKPFNTLCQFTGEIGDSTLANYIDIPNVYAAGRLDKDSEGLLILTNNGKLQNKISHPKHKMEKTYWVQVEGIITPSQITKLAEGVVLKDGKTKPAKIKMLDALLVESQLWHRSPPVRYRKNIPTSWIEVKIKEGKNRQVRRMTAAVDFPTLRLIRMQIGKWKLGDLSPGEYKKASRQSDK